MAQSVNRLGSNNTNKLSPQERTKIIDWLKESSNNTNKLSPQEHTTPLCIWSICSNNTNKLSPQELIFDLKGGV